MIKKFNTYINESLRDKLKGKELSGIHLEIYNATKQLETFNLNPIGIETGKGVYTFSITNIKNILINIYYFNHEEMINKWTPEYLVDQPNGWTIYADIYAPDRNMNKNKREKHNTETWEEMLKIILGICYPDVDNIIVNTKDRIEANEIKIEMENRLLKGLENAKKILNDN